MTVVWLFFYMEVCLSDVRSHCILAFVLEQAIISTTTVLPTFVGINMFKHVFSQHVQLKLQNETQSSHVTLLHHCWKSYKDRTIRHDYLLVQVYKFTSFQLTKTCREVIFLTTDFMCVYTTVYVVYLVSVCVCGKQYQPHIAACVGREETVTVCRYFISLTNKEGLVAF